MAGEGSMEELLSPQTRLWTYAYGCIKSMSVMVAVQLGIPDAIDAHGGRPISLSDLASAVGIPEAKVPVLRRLMRALSCFGVFDRDVEAGGGEAYLHTVFSRQLVKGSPTGGAALVLNGTYPLLTNPWYSMATWIRGEEPVTAASAFEAAHGETGWEAVRRLPEFGSQLDRAMAGDTRWSMGLVASEHPEVFRGLASLVDVGGRSGESAKIVKDAFPEIRCTVLDLPHVVATAPAVEGVDFLAGDMFEHIPPADGVLLKWVLHNFNDEDCVRILRRCREAIPARELGGKVIVVELVMVNSGGGGGGDHHQFMEAQHLFDLHMLMVTGQRERDEGEWRQIFAAAGFNDVKITPVGTRSVMEAYV